MVFPLLMNGWLNRQGTIDEKTARENEGVQRATPFGAGLGWREAQRRGLGMAGVPNKSKKRLKVEGSAASGVREGQSSVGRQTVMAGCGSSMSSGPQVAVSLTRRRALLSVRT